MIDPARPTSTLEDAAARRYADLFGAAPTILVRAPGRVNLIGEHTDYNDGFVFPAAINRQVVIAAAARPDDQVRAFAINFNASNTFTLGRIQPATENRERWSNYLRAIAWVLNGQGHELAGMNCVIVGDVPVGSGLSSSAAMLVAGGLAFAAASDFELSGVPLALAAQKAEREFVGVNVGIMDQFISALGQRGKALLIDTRSLSYEAVALPESGVSIVIADTNKRRGLVDSEYNARRAECEQAVDILKRWLPDIRALRDVTVADLEAHAADLPETTLKRARHVVTEDARTLEGVDALKAGNIALFGRLMDASHESLKNDYQVSCPELDAMVAAARSIRGVFGSRMTGAGFGGCTVSLVAEAAVPEFTRDVPAKYKAAAGLNASIYVTTASQGAQRLW